MVRNLVSDARVRFIVLALVVGAAWRWYDAARGRPVEPGVPPLAVRCGQPGCGTCRTLAADRMRRPSMLEGQTGTLTATAPRAPR